MSEHPSHPSPPSLREILRQRATEDTPGLVFEGRSWTWREFVAASADRAASLAALLTDDRPPHVGVLMENQPDLLFTLCGAALSGQVVVALNTTRRGSELRADVERTDCQLVLADAASAPLLEQADPTVPVIVVDPPAPDGPDDADSEHRLPQHSGAALLEQPPTEIGPETLVMLIFTSGTSGSPKAVRITHEKIVGPGRMLAERFGLGPGEVSYVAMPLFHSNAVMAGFGPALCGGATVALARRFSASGFLPDVRRTGAGYASYVGKPLSYILATPARPDDADNPLRVVFGNEANPSDIDAFAARFGTRVIDSYSSTENAVIVRREDAMPDGALGRPAEGVAVFDPETGREAPTALFGPGGDLLNPDQAIGEIVNTHGAGAFAGYYRDPDAEAERMRGGIYWSGDLAYRDADGWLYFAGRSAEWMRVDGENLATAPIERVLLRHPAVREAAVYALPDKKVGDQVGAALLLRPGVGADALTDLEQFLAAQEDLSPHAWPRYVRVLADLPRTATTKVLKQQLAAEGYAGGLACWRREERGTRYLPVATG